jgi:hypothetical protein
MEKGAAQKLAAMKLPPFMEPGKLLQGHAIEFILEPREISHMITSYFVRNILTFSS